MSVDIAERERSIELAAYHRGQIRELNSRVTLLEAEERRLYRLLGLALQVATSDGRDCAPTALLELLYAIDGTNPSRPAWVEESPPAWIQQLEEQANAAENARILQLLRDTDPARLTAEEVAA